MYNPKAKFDPPKDLKGLKRWADMLHSEFLNISRTMQLGSTYIVIGSTNDASSGSSGGGGATPTAGYRSGIQSLVVGATTITFSSPLIMPYVLIIEIYNSEGILMPQCTIDSNIPKTASGFTITTNEVVTIKYTAVSTT